MQSQFIKLPGIRSNGDQIEAGISRPDIIVCNIWIERKRIEAVMEQVDDDFQHIEGCTIYCQERSFHCTLSAEEVMKKIDLFDRKANEVYIQFN